MMGPMPMRWPLTVRNRGRSSETGGGPRRSPEHTSRLALRDSGRAGGRSVSRRGSARGAAGAEAWVPKTLTAISGLTD